MGKIKHIFLIVDTQVASVERRGFTEGLIEAIDFDQYRIVKGEEQKLNWKTLMPRLSQLLWVHLRVKQNSIWRD